MTVGVFSPYSTVKPYFATLPSWVPPADQERIAAYQTYEEIYWNVPESFKLVLRGTENKAIYIPSGKIIVETANRYIGKALKWRPDPLLGTTSDQANIMAAFNNLFAREAFASKYNANKRFGLIRGDWVFHVTGDDTKLQGERISLHAVDPASYFPITEDQIKVNGSPNRVVRVHLAEQFIDTDGIYGAKGKTLVRRQTYNKLDTGLIESSTLIADPDKWFDDTKAGTLYEVRPFTLDPRITAIPVYPIRNFDEPGNLFGSSEMRGLERLMAAVNQSVSDTDISLALEGLGLYATSSGGPVDEDGNDVDWIIGPGRVIENVPADFRRVSGVSSVKPAQDHVNLLMTFMKQASGTPDAAIGKIDVQVAESGVALALELAPILEKAGEKDQIITDALTQFAYGLTTMWFPVYEGQNFGEARMMPVLNMADKIPVNRMQVITEVTTMMMTDPPLLSATTGRQILAQELGIPFASDELTRIIQEQAALLEAAPSASSSADPEGDRLASEDTGDGSADGTE